MNSAFESGFEKLERQFIRWEKGLYACYAIAFTMLVHAVVKARENTVLMDALIFMERKTRTTNPLISSQYNGDIFYILNSPWRSILWIGVELSILIIALTLTLHPTWRNFPLAKRLDLIFGYFLAAWIVLLSLGAQNPDDIGNGFNCLSVCRITTCSGASLLVVPPQKGKGRRSFSLRKTTIGRILYT